MFKKLGNKKSLDGLGDKTSYLFSFLIPQLSTFPVVSYGRRMRPPFDLSLLYAPLGRSDDRFFWPIESGKKTVLML